MLGLDASKLPTRRIAAGDFLFRQGDRAGRIFYIVEGRLRLERHTPDGRHLVLHTAHAGEFFAEASLFADHYHCDAVAQTAATVRVYPKTHVLAAITADPTSAEGLLAYMARQLQATRQRAELRAVKSARERVVLYLESAADKRRQVVLHGQLQDIAAEIGLTREVFYRTFAGLERDGVIKRETGRIRLL
jgi:CRP/FNR family transcriptional regulator, dissimilatory nitrate respiration regulator